jgi:hypothetical protein
MPTRKARERNPKEFFETPPGFTRALARGLHPLSLGRGDRSRPTSTIFCPTVGQGAIVRVLTQAYPSIRFITNDIDPKWPADFHMDATKPEVWERALDLAGMLGIDWVVDNPPFGPAFDIIPHALRVARAGLCFHLRCTSLEPTKSRNAFWQAPGNVPDQINYLPRYGFSLNSEGKRSSDSATTTWHTWLRGETRDFARSHAEWQPIIVSPRAVRVESWELSTPLDLTT